MEFEIAHERSRLSEQHQELSNIQKVAATKIPLHSQQSPVSNQSQTGNLSKPQTSGKVSFIPTIENVDQTPGMNKPSVNPLAFHP